MREEIRINHDVPDRHLRIDGTLIPLREGASIRIVGPELEDDPIGGPEPFTLQSFIRNVQVDGLDIGELRECTLTERSVTVEVRGPVDAEVICTLMGWPLIDREELDANIQTGYSTHAQNSNAVKSSRARAFVGDRCISPIAHGYHESQYDVGHWVCVYCNFDTCLPGDCSFDKEDD